MKDCLLPLFLLHCKRGQARLPVASIAASLDAAGGKPLVGSAALAAAQLLAEATPEWLELENQPAAALILLRPDGNAGKSHRPATCAGVVAKGYSLALPQEGGPAGGKDAPSKRWKAAQQSFYADARSLERDLSSIQACILGRLQEIAEERSKQGEEPRPVNGSPAASPGAQSQKEKEGAGQGADESVLGFVSALEKHPDYREQVCHVKHYPPRPAKYASFETLVNERGAPLLSSEARRALKQMNIDELFEHQHTALRAVLGKKCHLCLTTGTSSGKSLAFALPILEAYRKDPNSKALVLFPTKALAQDQLGKLQKLFQQVCPGLGVCTFDGDTPKDDRARLLKSCHVFLTNPDMLHFTILASHARWRHVLEHLRYMVLDEAHVYRGSFGAHMALLLRRFRRVLKHYNSSPLFIACSATMSNAGDFFRKLVALEEGGEDVCVVDEDTAGRGDRQFCLWNPPLLEVEPGQPSREDQNARKRARFGEREGGGAAPRLPPGAGYRTRGSSYDEAAWIVSQAARRGHRTVCFLQVRALVEIVLQAANKHLDDRPDLQGRIAGYRGGYAAVERRKLERRLFTGDLLCVFATNALELGIDIGDLDLTLHIGVPPTVASVWQQAGRAGRRGRPSTAILIAMDAPLEQHFCRNPEDFFSRSIEARLPDTSNELLLKGHMLCAAAELPPLSGTDANRWFGEVAKLQDELLREGRLVVQPVKPGMNTEAGVLMRVTQGKGRRPPKEEVSLRDIDPIQFQVVVRGNSHPLETLDQKLAYMRLHPGAIYLNQQTSYFVEELDLTKKIAWVIPRDSRKIEYYTECREHSVLVLAGGGVARAARLPSAELMAANTPVVRSGQATVHWNMYGFRKKSKKDHSIMDQVDLTLPAVEYPTRATWMDLPGVVLQPIAQEGSSVDRGGLHALEHAMMAMAPLCCDIEVSELSCQHTRRDSDPNRYFLLLYEHQKGGTGASEKVYKGWEDLVGQAVRLMEECPCDNGCPNCIVIPGCGDYNHGLDKRVALKIGRALGFGAASTVAARSSVTTVTTLESEECGAKESEIMEVEQKSSTIPRSPASQPTREAKRLCFGHLKAGGQTLCFDLD